MSKAASSVSIIGGSDGPASIFLVGKKYREKNPIKRFKQLYHIKKHQYKLNRVKKFIQPGAYTLEDTICYMEETFGIREADFTSPYYDVNRREMRFALVQRERIDLLPKQPELDEIHDKEAVAGWLSELDEWEKQARAIVEKLPPEVLNMDYRLFVLDKGEDGSMQVDMEMNRGLMQVQYSGTGFGSIQKAIYLYYGVSKEDITDKTERYQNLVTVLAL